MNETVSVEEGFIVSVRHLCTRSVCALSFAAVLSAAFAPAAMAVPVRDGRPVATASLTRGTQEPNYFERFTLRAFVQRMPRYTDDVMMRIEGGVPPFQVAIVGTDGSLTTVYTGSLRRVMVPVLAGATVYRVSMVAAEAYRSGTAGIAAKPGPSTETSIAGDMRFWVANTATRMVRRYDALTDTITASVWVRGADTTASVTLRNVAVRPSDDHVFVVFSDGGSGAENRLIELGPTGSFVATIPVPGSYKIQDVTFDPSGNIYVSDRGTGYFGENRVRISKISPVSPYSVVATTQTVLPPNAYIGYPMVNLSTMLDFQPVANRLIARINTGTFAVLNPSTLAIESYRYSGCYGYQCMALNTSDETSVTLYTGESGFYRPSFYAKEVGFLNDARYLDPSIIENPFFAWQVTPTLPAVTDVAIDSNNFVYTIQHDGVNGITRAYIVNPDGGLVKTVDLPDGTRISVVR